MRYHATLEDLNKNGFGKFQNEEGNLYINSYEKEFENISDTNFILNSIFNGSQHQELNSIGYYSINDEVLSHDEKIMLKILYQYSSQFLSRDISSKEVY